MKAPISPAVAAQIREAKIKAAQEARWAKGKAQAADLHPSAGFSPEEYEQLSPQEKAAAAQPKPRTAAQLAALAGVELPAPCTFAAHEKNIMKIETRNLDDLTIHPALKNQPRLAQDHPTMLAMRREMKRRGEDNQPRAILVTPENEIVDGRHWWWNAKALAWKQVRVEVVAENEVNALIMATLVNRRHYSKGQLAYIVAPMVENVFKEARNRMQWAAKSDPSALSAKGSDETPESIAASMGISYRVLAQAQEIHEYFKVDTTKRTMTDRDDVTEKGVTLREFFEPRILLEEDPEAPRTRAYGLGAVLAGIKALLNMEGKQTPHGGGRPESVQKQLDLFETSLTGFTAKFDYWKKWELETRQAACAALPPVVEKMPDDLLAEFAKAIKTELKRRETK